MKAGVYMSPMGNLVDLEKKDDRPWALTRVYTRNFRWVLCSDDEVYSIFGHWQYLSPSPEEWPERSERGQ